ncbi:MAG: MFS transporter [Thermodesulforhabdaceae bacterium]
MKTDVFALFSKGLLTSIRESREVAPIALSQFGLAFCFNVVMSFMPFYIIHVSPYSYSQTIVWIGLIMGLNSFLAAIAAPFWGSLTSKIKPKLLFQMAFCCNAIVFILIGFATNLPTILALRLMQGILGGASTIGLFMISRISPRERLLQNLGLYQISITSGQLLGPPVGAYLAAHLGYKSPFVFSFLLIMVSVILCQITVPDLKIDGFSHVDSAKNKSGTYKVVIWGWGLILIATVHLTFLPSILPYILKSFGISGQKAIKIAGFIMMSYTAAAIIGNYTISNLMAGKKLSLSIGFVSLAAALFQILLIFAKGPLSFTIIRVFQTGVVAATMPLVMTRFAIALGGTGIGFLNSARFAGNALGPLIATSVLAHSNLLVLYVLISALTIFIFLGFFIADRFKSS